MKNKLFIFMLYFLTLFDFLFFNIDIGIVNITLLRLTIFTLFIYYILSLLVYKKIIMSLEVRIVFTLLLLWLINMLFTLTWAIDSINVYKGIYYFIIFIILMFLIVKIVNTDTILLFTEKLIYYSAVIISFLGIVEYLTSFRMKPSRYNLIEFINVLEKFNFNAVTGMFHNENNYSLFLGMCIPFVLLGLMKKNKTKFILSIITLSMIVFIVVINDAKLILIMIFIEIILFLLLINISLMKKILFIFIFFMFSIISFALKTNIFNNFSKLASQIETQTGSGFIRLNLLKNTKYILNETNYLGSGIGGFKDYLNPNLYFQGITDPHNWWMELLTENGVIVFIVFIIIYSNITIRLYKVYKYKHENERFVYLALFLTSIGFIIGSTSPSGVFNYLPMWFFYGVSLAAINISNITHKKISKE